MLKHSILHLWAKYLPNVYIAAQSHDLEEIQFPCENVPQLLLHSSQKTATTDTTLLLPSTATTVLVCESRAAIKSLPRD